MRRTVVICLVGVLLLGCRVLDAPVFVGPRIPEFINAQDQKDILDLSRQLLEKRAIAELAVRFPRKLAKKVPMGICVTTDRRWVTNTVYEFIEILAVKDEMLLAAHDPKDYDELTERLELISSHKEKTPGQIGEWWIYSMETVQKYLFEIGGETFYFHKPEKGTYEEYLAVATAIHDEDYVIDAENKNVSLSLRDVIFIDRAESDTATFGSEGYVVITDITKLRWQGFLFKKKGGKLHLVKPLLILL